MSKMSTPESKASIERELLNEKLRFVRDEAGKKAIVVTASTPTELVLAEMREKSSGGVLVIDENNPEKLVGIFTTRDYLDKLAGVTENLSEPISGFMTSTPTTLSPEHTVGDAIHVMTVGGYRHVPLLEDGTQKLSGLVSVRDIIHFISDHFPEEVYNHPPVLNQPIETQEGG